MGSNEVYGWLCGFAAFLVLFLDLLVWREIFLSDRDVITKLAWATLVFFFPIGGVIIYMIFAHRSQHSGYSAIV